MNLRWLEVTNIWVEGEYTPEYLLRRTYDKRRLQMEVDGEWLDVPITRQEIRHTDDRLAKRKKSEGKK